MNPDSPTWYSVTVETAHGDGWLPLERPCTQVFEGTADELAEEMIQDYDLSDAAPTPWRVRVYAGYNTYVDVLAERSNA